jgi:transcriptional repressor NrdR
MRCPYCGEPSHVLESRPAEGGAAVRRRRECQACGRRYTTFERYERGRLFVRKRSGRRQPFDREKLRFGLGRAAHKRPVAEAKLDAIVDRIEEEIDRAGGELDAQRIGEMCLEELRALDRISYLQFASVYKEFADLDAVREELADLSAEGRRKRRSGAGQKTRNSRTSGRRGSVRGEGEDSSLPRKSG